MLIIILCDTRVGSTAFGRALESDALSFHGEVLYAGNPGGEFIQELSQMRIEGHEARESNIKDFSIYLKRYISSTKAHALDIKYHDIYSIPKALHRPSAGPPIIHLIKQQAAVIIHLNRKSRFRAALSELIAQQTSVYHISQSETGPSQRHSISIDVQSLFEKSKDRELCFRIAQRWIHEYPHCLELFYEDLFLSDTAQKDAIRSLRQITGCEGITFHPRTQKISGLLNIKIDNIDEILSNSKDTVWQSDAERLYEEFPN